MSFDDIFRLGSWGWFIAGLILMGLEVLAPGAFMLWLGLAAIATSVRIERGAPQDRAVLLASVLEGFERRYARLLRDGPATLLRAAVMPTVRSGSGSESRRRRGITCR